MVHRIDGATAAAALPAAGAVVGTPGYFSEGTPGVTPATVVSQAWANMVQEELMAVVVDAGLTPTKGTNTQIRDAIKTRPGRLLATQVFIAGGTYTPTAGMASCIIECQGGGGAGGGASGATGGNVSLGAPGTAGTYAKGRFLAAAIGASQTVTVGSGGVPVSGAGGGNGGQSSVGSLIVAPGGIGGNTLSNQAPPNINGNGSFSSAATGGNIVSSLGAAGPASLTVSAAIGVTGIGGQSQFGAGGYQIGINVTGPSAVNPGAGGGAAIVNSSGGSIFGGAGFRGIVIIQEFS